MQRQRHLADLIEKQRPTIRQLEDAGPRRDTGGDRFTTWVTFSKLWRQTSHQVEVVWDGADPGRSNGSLTFSINGSTQVLSALDNDSLQIDHVRFGMVGGIDANTQGRFVFDEFESCRD